MPRARRRPASLLDAAAGARCAATATLLFFMCKTRASLRVHRSAPLAILLVLGLTGLPSATSSATEGTSVEATIVLSQPALGRLDLLGVLLVHAHALDGRTATAAEIASTAGSDGHSPVLAALEAAARDALAQTLARADPQARTYVGLATVDRASLDAARAGTAPIKMTLGAFVERPREATGLGPLSDEAARAALEAGARWTTDLTLAAPPGYATTYVLKPPTLPAGLRIVAASAGTLGPGGEDATVLLDNLAGESLHEERVSITLADAAAAPPQAESLAQRVDLALGALAPGATGLPVEARILLDVHALDVEESFPGLLPPALALPFVDAHGVRALARAGALSPADLARAEERLLARLGPVLAPALPDAALAGAFEPESLTGAAGSPIRFVARATGEHPLGAGAARDADVALALGATLSFDLQLASSAIDTTFVVHPPERTAFAGAEGDAADAARIVVPAGAPGRPTTLALRSVDAPTLAGERRSVGIVVDISDVDVSLTGEPRASLRGEVEVALRLHVLTVPASVQERMGPHVELTHVSSDGIRLLVARGLLDERQLHDSVRAAVRAAVERALGVPLADAQLDTLSITHAPATPLSDADPLVFTVRGGFAKPLGASAPPQGQASIQLYTLTQAFDLPRLDGADTRYALLLPRGVALAQLDVTGGEHATWDKDGRAGFSVLPGGDGARATAMLAVTPGFLVAHFGPWLAAVALALALAIAAPLARARMRARRR